MNVTKHSLVTDVSVTTGVSQKDTKKVVECFLDFITHHLEKGNTIEIRGRKEPQGTTGAQPKDR